MMDNCKLRISLFLLILVVSSYACSESKSITLVAEIGGTTISGPAGNVQVSADSILPLVVHKIVDGQNIDITNDANLIIEISGKDRASVVDGNVHIKPFVPGELLSPNDFGLSTLVLVYHDDVTGQHGVNFITLRIIQ